MGRQKHRVWHVKEIMVNKEEAPDTRNSCAFKIWNVLDNPSSSLLARLWYLLSLLVVSLAILSFILNTIPSIATRDEDGNKFDNSLLAFIVLICVLFCAFEFLLRFIFSPSKLVFLKHWLNIVDLLVVLHYIISLVIVSTGIGINKLILNILQALKFLWVLKLIRYSSGLQDLTLILFSLAKEVILLIQVIIVWVLLVGVLMHHAEEQEMSIPDYLWFGVITMTTVGYGDITPMTGTGRFLGSIFAVLGLILMIFPILIISEKFLKLWKQKEYGQHFLEKKEEDDLQGSA